MSEKKLKCRELYEEYKKLAEKTHLKVEEYIPGKPLSPQYINPDDLLKKEELRLKLLECKNHLDLGLAEWFEIENG